MPYLVKKPIKVMDGRKVVVLQPGAVISDVDVWKNIELYVENGTLERAAEIVASSPTVAPAPAPAPEPEPEAEAEADPGDDDPDEEPIPDEPAPKKRLPRKR